MWQKTTITVSGTNYKLIGLVKYTRLSKDLGHYTAFIRSHEDNMQWFHADDKQVNNKVYIYAPCITYYTCIWMQISPVSTVTAMMQDPFMAVYEKMEGVTPNTESLSYLTPLLSSAWLTDKVAIKSIIHARAWSS